MTADQIQTRDPDEIDDLDQKDPEKTRDETLRGGCWKRQDGRHEKKHRLETIASILNIDGKAWRSDDRAFDRHLFVHESQSFTRRHGDAGRERPDDVFVDRPRQQWQFKDKQEHCKTEKELPASTHFHLSS